MADPVYLDDLEDVSVPDPADGDVLYWDEAASLWKCHANYIDLLFDDFNDNDLDLAKWVVLKGGASDVLEQNQVLDIKCDAVNTVYCRTKVKYSCASSQVVINLKATQVNDTPIISFCWDGIVNANNLPKNGYCILYRSWQAPHRFELRKYVNGVKTELDTFEIELNADQHTYIFTLAQGGGISVKYDGDEVLTSADTAFTFGYAGLSSRFVAFDRVASYDDVSIRKWGVNG